MSTSSSKPWPPPPDLASIQELVANADVDGFIAEGAHADEYESEAEQIFEKIAHLAIDDLVAAKLLPIVESIWADSFKLDASALEAKRPQLSALAGEIERFFGPGARPQVRGA